MKVSFSQKRLKSTKTFCRRPKICCDRSGIRRSSLHGNNNVEFLARSNYLCIYFHLKSFFSRCFLTGERSNYFVLEDLKDSSFCSANKMNGLDFDHMKLTVTCLAKWHATTKFLSSKVCFSAKSDFQSFAYAFQLQNPDPFKLFEKSDLKTPAIEMFLTNISKTLAALTASWPEFESISKKFAQISHEGFLKLYKACVSLDDDFFVLTHGDMWLNNFFYKYGDNKKPTEVMLVRNQIISFWIPRFQFVRNFNSFSLTLLWLRGFQLLPICSL